MVAGVDFGDPDFARAVRDGVARVDELIAAELSSGDELKNEGIISIGDVVRALLTNLNFENKMLRNYIKGSYPV